MSAPDLVALGASALRRDVLVQDLGLLLAPFSRLEAARFRDMRRLWIDRDMSLLHFACANAKGREALMHALYQCAMEHWARMQPSAWVLRLGVVYVLLLLYETQPDCFDKVAIRMSMQDAQMLVRVARECAQGLRQPDPPPGAVAASYRDALWAIHRLRQQHALVWSVLPTRVGIPGSAEEDLSPGLELQLLGIEHSLMTSDTAGDPMADDPLAELQAVSEAYEAQLEQLGPPMGAPAPSAAQRAFVEHLAEQVERDRLAKAQGSHAESAL